MQGHTHSSSKSKQNTNSEVVPHLNPTPRTTVQATAEETPETLEQVRQKRLEQERLGFNIADVPLSAPVSSPTIQTKLTIGSPGDQYEQEADQVAGEVMSRINNPQPVSKKEQVVQTKALQSESEEETVNQNLETEIEGSRGQGQTMPDNVRVQMESAFGADFSSVKVHNDSKSDQLSNSIQARAFTTGQDIYFRQGEYNPESREGQHLLAHELTHTLQQNGTQPQRDPIQPQALIQRFEEAGGDDEHKEEEMTAQAPLIQRFEAAGGDDEHKEEEMTAQAPLIQRFEAAGGDDEHKEEEMTAQASLAPREDLQEEETVSQVATPSIKTGVPSYLQTIFRKAQGDTTQYQQSLKLFRQANPNTTLNAYRGKMGEGRHPINVQNTSTLKQIRSMGRGSSRTRPTLAQALADATVLAGLQQAWVDSNPNAPDVYRGNPGSQKQEQGGWIVWNFDTSSFRVIRVGAGTRDGLGPIVGTRPADTDTEVVVAWFHTHPNKASEGYGAEPSPPDIGYTNSEARVPGIVETHDGRKIIPYP